MKNVLGNAGYWAGGTVVAIAGIFLARVVAPHVDSHRIILTVGGQMLALAGLLLICFGVSRRVNRDRGSIQS